MSDDFLKQLISEEKNLEEQYREMKSQLIPIETKLVAIRNTIAAYNTTGEKNEQKKNTWKDWVLFALKENGGRGEVDRLVEVLAPHHPQIDKKKLKKRITHYASVMRKEKKIGAIKLNDKFGKFEYHLN